MTPPPLRAVALALVVSGAGCYGPDSLFDRPRVTFQRAEVRDLSLSGLTVAFVVTVENPNVIAVDLAQLGYRLALDGRTVAQGSSSQGLHVPKRHAGELTVPISVTFADLAASAEQLFARATLPYGVHLDFGFGTSAGVVTIPVDAQGTLHLPRPAS